MERLRLMLGNTPIIKRYIGNKLIWEYTTLLKKLEGCFLMFNDDFSEFISVAANDYRFTDANIVKRITVNDVEVNTMKSFKYSNYQFYIYFASPEDKEAFIQKMGWQGESSIAGVTIKLYRE
nr:MAG TPA: hypothetical protein [Caudoviricetes sp.]